MKSMQHTVAIQHKILGTLLLWMVTLLPSYGFGEDAYEVDDTLTQATEIQIEYEMQEHNFHDADDEDWYTFDVPADFMTVAFLVNNPGVNCDAVIELYYSDGTSLLFTHNEAGKGSREDFRWSFIEKGRYYAKVRQFDPNDFGEQTNYSFSIVEPVTGILCFIEGIVTDALTGSPISGVLIKTSGGATTASLPNGHYLLLHEPGTFAITGEVYGYALSTYPDVVVVEAASITQNIRLTPLNAGSDGDGTPNSADSDDDNDGVNDDVEAAGPNGGDANEDGIPDSVQRNVASIASYTAQGHVIIESPDGTTISGCQAAGPPSPADAPAGVTFDYGFLSFTISGIPSGGATVVTITLPDQAAPAHYYKYGKTPTDAAEHWYPFPFDGETGAAIEGNVITLHFADASRGDDVSVQDGRIVDPGGPAFSMTHDEEQGSAGGVGAAVVDVLWTPQEKNLNGNHRPCRNGSPRILCNPSD